MAANEEKGKRDDLETRAFGITSMVFAFAVFGIYVSYAVALDTLRDHGIPFALWSIWAPWLFGASLIITAVWRLRAKALGIERRKVGTWLTYLYKLMFLAVLLGLTFLAPSEQPWAHITVAVGVLLLALAHIHDLRFDGRITMLPHYMAGFASIAFALAMSTLELHTDLVGLVHGIAVGTFYYAAGLYTYHRGTRRPHHGKPATGPLDDHATA